MPKDISAATSSDMTNVVEDWEVTALSTDGTTDQDETEWVNSKWTTYWGYFNSIPDLKSAILMKAIWNVGKGYTADPETQVILDHITGKGKDTFEDILFNMEVIRRVGGDSFAEIIKDEETGILVNLKPLDPGSMKIIYDRKGIIKRYEQTNKLPKGERSIIKFKPEDIFHLSNNYLADQIHGISDIEALEETIKAEAESFKDIKQVMHHQAKPFIVFKLKTDNQTKIDELVAKIDTLRNKGEDLYIPDDEDIFSYEVVQVNVNQFVLAWRDDIRNKFYRAMGLPLIVFGQAGQTESGGKIEYLAHEQVFEHDQKYIERHVWEQLGLRIDLIPPTSLLDNLQTDQRKDAAQGMEIQPQDLTAAKGGG